MFTWIKNENKHKQKYRFTKTSHNSIISFFCFLNYVDYLSYFPFFFPLHRTHQMFHIRIKIMTLLHSLHSVCASVIHTDAQELFEKMLIHKFPWVWRSGSEPVEIANKHWSCCVWCEHKQPQRPHSHTFRLCVRLCMCSSAREAKWEKVRRDRVCVWLRGLEGVSKALQH